MSPCSPAQRALMLLCTRIHHVGRSIATNRARQGRIHSAQGPPSGAHAGAKIEPHGLLVCMHAMASACSELCSAPSLTTLARRMSFVQVVLLPWRSTEAAAGWRRRARDRTTISMPCTTAAEVRLRWPSSHRSRTSAADILLKLVLGFDPTEGLLDLADGRDEARACADARACHCTRPQACKATYLYDVVEW